MEIDESSEESSGEPEVLKMQPGQRGVASAGHKRSRSLAEADDDASDGSSGNGEQPAGGGGSSGGAGAKRKGAAAKSAPARKSGGRTRLSTAQKKEIVTLLGQRKTQADVARQFGVGLRTVRRIKAQEAAINALVASCSNAALQRRSLNPAGAFPELESEVLRAIDVARSVARLPVNRATIQAFALKARADLLGGSNRAAAGKAALEGFSAGEHWVTNFVRRHGLKSKLLSGEGGSVDEAAVAAGVSNLVAEITAGGYGLDEIYNVDETGLFYRVLPRRSYLSATESGKTARGTKEMKTKDRLTAYVCTNASGTHKLPMVVIGSAASPRCFNNAPKKPAHYLHQKRAWSDQVTFSAWWTLELLPEVRRRTSRPVILIVDNCSGHGSLEDPRQQVKVTTLPPNCTAKRQPMDQGIIAALKMRYRSALLARRVATLETRQQLLEAAKARKMAAGTMGLAEGKDPHVLDAIELLDAAWAGVSQETVAHCWLKAEILPPALQAELAKASGKAAAAPLDDAAFAGLSAMLERLQLDAGAAPDEQGVAEALLALQIGGVEEAGRRWALLEEEPDVAEALRQDLCGELWGDAKAAAEAAAGADEEAEDEEEATKEQAAVAAPPPRYAGEIAEAFEFLEAKVAAAENKEALAGLRSAKMAVLAAYANRPAVQTVIRDHFKPAAAQSAPSS